MFSTLERSFLALDWDPDLKKRYFDENAAEVSHHSYFFIFSILITLFLHSLASTKCIYFASINLVMYWKIFIDFKHVFWLYFLIVFRCIYIEFT